MIRLRISIAVFLAFVLGISLSLPQSVHAWGKEGHEVVALIAANHLTPSAQQAVRRLLGNQSLASVANFADAIRDSRPETAPLHFVDIQITENDYVPRRDCREVNRRNEVRGDCVVEAVKHYSQVLADSRQIPAKRAEALKFIVHFVGDLHQPLHDADNNDRGGNGFKVSFFGRSSNLHSVWDSGLLDRNGRNSSQLAAELEGGLTPSQIAEMQSGTIETWVVEAHRLAQNKSYGEVPNNHVIGTPYFQSNIPVVKVQLARGGVRLAKLLNEILR